MAFELLKDKEKFYADIKEICAKHNGYSSALALSTAAFRQKIFLRMDELMMEHQKFVGGPRTILVGYGGAGVMLASMYGLHQGMMVKVLEHHGKLMVLHGSDGLLDHKLTRVEDPKAPIPCYMVRGSILDGGDTKKAIKKLNSMGYEVKAVFTLLDLAKKKTEVIGEVPVYSCVTMNDLEPPEEEDDADSSNNK